MMAHVVDGRITIDGTVDLPEGMEGEMVLFEKALSDQSPEERAHCEAVIAERYATLRAEGKFLLYGYPVHR